MAVPKCLKCCRTRNPVEARLGTVALPILLCLSTLGGIIYFSLRIDVKSHSNWREVDCQYVSTSAEQIDGHWYGFHNVEIDGINRVAWKNTAETRVGFNSKEEAAGFMPKKNVGENEECFLAGEAQDSYIKLTRTRAPVWYDYVILLTCVLLFGLAASYLAWIMINRVANNALGRDFKQVRALVVGMNYTLASQVNDGISELTGITDSDNFVKMLENCGVQDITYLTDDNYRTNALMGRAPTAAKILEEMEAIGSRCSDDDMFMFFYAGHGDGVEDLDGDESDGQDEAFVLMDSTCTADWEETYLVDDDFSAALLDNFPVATRIMVMTDCCHSGTICDLEKPGFEDRCIFHIAGALDQQEANDTGYGGAATTAMIEVLQEMDKSGEKGFSVQKVFNRMQWWMLNQGFTCKTAKIDPSAQDIRLNFTGGTKPDMIPWPLKGSQSGGGKYEFDSVTDPESVPLQNGRR